MDSTIGRVKCLDVVEIVRNGPHLDHTFPVVGSEALDLGPPSMSLAPKTKWERIGKSWKPTCFGTKPGLAEDSGQGSPSIVAPDALHLDVVAWRIHS